MALTAMVVLCITLAFFWYLFPLQFNFKKATRIAIQVSGFLAMMIGLFLFTNSHDIVINTATLFGFVALAGLKRLKWRKLFWMGLFTLVLITLNNALYYTKGGLFYLPVLQKATFLYFLLWICLITLQLYAMARAKQNVKLFQNPI